MIKGKLLRVEMVPWKKGIRKKRVYEYTCDGCGKTIEHGGAGQLPFCECKSETKECEICGETIYRFITLPSGVRRNLSDAEWETRRACSCKCASELRNPSPLKLGRTKKEQSANLRKIKVSELEKNDKSALDKRKCCANCAIYDTNDCPAITANTEKYDSFDMFEFVCDDFYFYRG